MKNNYNTIKRIALYHTFVTLSVVWMLVSGWPGSASAQDRILDGVDTLHGDYPWMAALVRTDRSAAASQFCGGSLIAPNYVITAAHCVDFTFPDEIEVVLRHWNLVDYGGERIAVKRIIGHPQWFEIRSHDIALLELAKPTFTSPVGLIEPDSTIVRPGRLATVMGWGRTRTGNTSRRQQVDLPIVSHSYCERNYAAVDVKIEKDLHVCAGYTSGGRNACFGDSGGPLFMPDSSTGQPALFGIVSFGNGCGTPRFPVVYARISTQLDWIDRQVRGIATQAESSDLNPHFARIDHACFGLSCTFDGRRSYGDPSPVISYEWDMGDGSTLNGSIVRHAYASAGSDTVVLKATRADGTIDKVYKRVHFDASLRNDFQRVTKTYSSRFGLRGDIQYVPRKRFETGMWLYAGGVSVELGHDQRMDATVALQRFDESTSTWKILATGGVGRPIGIKTSSGFHRLQVTRLKGTGNWTLSINARRIAVR